MRIKLSGRFKKDLKRYQNRTGKIAALGKVIKFLQMDGRVPVEYRPHKLHGDYEGCMECHIEGDFLLVWIDEEAGIVKLLRLGTHHELFGL